jgi:hypothetical protein
MRTNVHMLTHTHTHTQIRVHTQTRGCASPVDRLLLIVDETFSLQFALMITVGFLLSQTVNQQLLPYPFMPSVLHTHQAYGVHLT